MCASESQQSSSIFVAVFSVLISLQAVCTVKSTGLLQFPSVTVLAVKGLSRGDRCIEKVLRLHKGLSTHLVLLF